MLAEYDVAAWHATDAVMALNPPKGSTTGYIAKKSEAGWMVVFGRMNETRDKYLIVYQAKQEASPEEFKAIQEIPPQEDTSYFLVAGRALDVARQDFKGENRPYNASVLPAESGQLYVYIYPAQTTTGVYPLGGDARYLISSDGSTIVEKRQLHKTIQEVDLSKIPSGAKPAGHFHTHVLSDVPEDTDVFYVLSRSPRVPEYVATGKHVFSILVDGTIRIVK